MIVASSNNLGQIGALIGKSAGLYLMLGSTAALLGVSLFPKLMEWADGTAKVRKRPEVERRQPEVPRRRNAAD